MHWKTTWVEHRWGGGGKSEWLARENVSPLILLSGRVIILRHQYLWIPSGILIFWLCWRWAWWSRHQRYVTTKLCCFPIQHHLIVPGNLRTWWRSPGLCPGTSGFHHLQWHISEEWGRCVCMAHLVFPCGIILLKFLFSKSSLALNMLDSFSSLAFAHFNRRTDVHHQKGTRKCLGSVAEASFQTRFIFVLKKGDSQTSKVAAKGFSGGKVSGEILFAQDTPCTADETAESNFLPSCIVLNTALRKRRLNPGRRRSVSEMTAANTVHKQETNPQSLPFHKTPVLNNWRGGRKWNRRAQLF